MIDKILLKFTINSKAHNSRNKMYQCAYAWCHHSTLAENLVSDTLFISLSKKSELQNINQLETWLFRNLLTTWHDYLKRKKILNIDEYVFSCMSDDSEYDHMTGELVSRVRQEVSKLQLSLREIITLIDFSGFSYQEISEITLKPVATVKNLLYRARSELENKLLNESKVEVDNFKQWRYQKIS